MFEHPKKYVFSELYFKLFKVSWFVSDELEGCSTVVSLQPQTPVSIVAVGNTCHVVKLSTVLIQIMWISAFL